MVAVSGVSKEERVLQAGWRGWGGGVGGGLDDSCDSRVESNRLPSSSFNVSFFIFQPVSHDFHVSIVPLVTFVFWHCKTITI